MTRRYYSHRPIDGSRATLDGAEAHHLLHVMRAQVGERVTLFDGRGCEFTAELRRCGRGDVELDVLRQHEVDRELDFQLTLAVALPKGDRQRWLVEKLVELGVTRLAPLRTQRSVAQPSGSALDRLTRAVVEASKQCGRNRLLEIAEPCDWEELLWRTDASWLRIVAHPGGQSLSSEMMLSPGTTSGQSQADTSPVIAAIGPEGGLSDEEISSALEAGWKLADLGPRILRIETAALFVAAWFAGTRD